MKFVTYVLVFIILSQFPPLNGLLRLFSGDSIMTVAYDNLYVSGDLKYQYHGYLKDTAKNDCYRQFRILFPTSDPTLYRVQPIEPWKFWRWAQYVTEEKWRQPYRKVSDNEMKEADSFFVKKYNIPTGTCH